MKQKLLIFLFLVLLIALLVGLNAASYTQKEKSPDNEAFPNRSSFNAGSTGTQAYYTLLAESGRKVTRWQQAPAALLTAGKTTPEVFVVVGAVKREFETSEVELLLRWVSNGGQLVLIDREPPEGLLTTTANWTVKMSGQPGAEVYGVDPADQKQMMDDTAAVKAVQPTLFTQNINAIQPSKFAASVTFSRFFDRDSGHPQHPPPPPVEVDEEETETHDFYAEPTPAPPVNSKEPSSPSKELEPVTSPTPDEPYSTDYDEVAAPSQIAPLVHFAGGGKNLVVDAPFGNGRIVVLSDPFIVSNVGISLVDNAQLGINLVQTGGDGLIAFDEYHQGFGIDNNRFLQFFEGTPVVAIFLQMVLLVGLVFFSQSRRFARPVPEPEPDRLSKLEYVAAMAELQNRTKAYDLAVENIYGEFRRRVARYFGLDNFTAKSGEVARLIAERSGLDQRNVSLTLFKCEEIIRGEPTNKHEVVELIETLRTIEQKLGLSRSAKTRI